MNNPPRAHHFGPQFWIKRFAGSDGKIWAYDRHDDRVEERSSKRLMQLFNLYTVQPSGLDDTTLETVDLNKIDREGNALFDRVLSGDRSQDAKEELANFLAAQMLRDPETVVSYNPKAQELALALLDMFGASDHQTFAQYWSTKYPGTHVTQHEYNRIKSFGLKGAENALEQIIAALDATDGLPELPFTDAVRSPDGRKVVRDRLLTFDWWLKSASDSGFVLGDTGVLYDGGALDSLRASLSNAVALYLTPTDNPTPDIKIVAAHQHEVESLNLESAARSRRWLVGDKSLLEKLKSQVGNKPLPTI
jgi:hypothetical protein